MQVDVLILSFWVTVMRGSGRHNRLEENNSRAGMCTIQLNTVYDSVNLILYLEVETVNFEHMRTI